MRLAAVALVSVAWIIRCPGESVHLAFAVILVSPDPSPIHLRSCCSLSVSSG